MKKTYRKKPTKRYDLGGDIGAGFAGAAKGIVGTVLPGPLGSMAMQGVDAIHGAIDKDITDQELAIRGYGQAAGAAGAAIVSGGSLTGQAIGVGAQGLGQGISNTNSDDPNMQMIGQGINLAGQIGGMAYGNAQDKKLAMGGKMQQGTNGGQEQLNQFNGGGTHEENPMGGIPVGNGQSVEAGETEFTPENYVFSDRLKSNKVLAKEFGFKNSNKTFAELSKAIDKKYSTRNSDSMDEESKTRELSRLMEAQEAVKEEKMQKDLARFEKEQPELFAQMQAQAQQAAQGQGQPQQEQPQQQMPEGGMPQGMGQAGQMAMGGYRMTDNKQYDEGGDLGKLYQMYRKGIITQEELNSYREDLDMGVNFQTVFGQINYNQSQNDSEATPFTTEAQAKAEYAKRMNAPVTNEDLKSMGAPQNSTTGSEMTSPKGYNDETIQPWGEVRDENGNVVQQAAPRSNTAAPSNSTFPSEIDMAGGQEIEDLESGASTVDPMVTPEEEEVTATPEDPSVPKEKPFDPGLANRVGQLAPIAFNMFQGLKKEDTLNAGDYMTDQRIDPATMNADPMLRKNAETFQGTLNAVRSGAGGSGGLNLANLQSAQLRKQTGDAGVLTAKSNYDEQQRVGADQANIRLDQQNNQIRRGVDDFNLRSKATKENALGDAANNIASMTTANMQTKANAYGYSKMAPMYEYMFNNYTKNNTKSNTTDNKNETTT